MANSTDRLVALSVAVQANQINNPPPLSQRVLSEFAYTGGSLLGGVDVGIAPPDYIPKLLVSPDGTILAAGTSSGAVSIWDTKTQTLKYKFEALKNSVWVLRFSPDSHRLLVGGGNIGEGIGIAAESGELSLWDMTTGHLIKQLEGHKQIVLSLAFSADNTLAVSSGFDGNLFVWDANTGAQLHAIVPQKIAGSIVGGTPSGVMKSTRNRQSRSEEHTSELQSPDH